MLVALTAAIGNLLQGWDNATIAGIFCLISCSFFSCVCVFCSLEKLSLALFVVSVIYMLIEDKEKF